MRPLMGERTSVVFCPPVQLRDQTGLMNRSSRFVSIDHPAGRGRGYLGGLQWCNDL